MYKSTILWWSATVLLLVVFVSTCPRVWQCEGVDEIEYLGLAHSLVLGDGYTLYGAPHVLYPPFFAFILSLLMRLFGGTSWLSLYMFNAVVGASGVILAGSWIRRRFGDVGVWASWFMLTAYYAWSFSTRFLMTEPIYLLVSFLAIILAWRILERKKGYFWEYALYALCCFLITFIRSAAISLVLALTAAGTVRWIGARCRAGLAVALMAVTLGGGFFAFWSMRADVIDPNAPESHWRWAKKFMGISHESGNSMVAKGEEETEYSRKVINRVEFLALRYGQYITSVVRPPLNFLPFSVVLFALFLAGWAVHWYRWPWSPLAWYAAVFLSMILMTTWLSNYHRFLFVLSPILFLFLLEGVGWWIRAATANRLLWLLPVLIGIWGVAVTICVGEPFGGHESVYRVGMRWLLLICYVGLMGVGFLQGMKALFWKWPAWMALLVWLLLLIHSGILLQERFGMTRKLSSPKAKNLEGMIYCGSWLADQTPATARTIASFPRMASFLAERRILSPVFTGSQELDVDHVNYVLLTGEIHGIPQFPNAEERRLKKAVEQLTQEQRLQTVFSSDDARILQVVPP